jgi:hypothetical protein
MPKNKKGLLLRYRETHNQVVHNEGAYPYEDVAAAVADCQVVSRFSFASTSTSQATSNTFSLESAVYQNASYVVPPNHVAPTVTFAVTPSIVATSTAAAVVVNLASPTVLAHQAPTSEKLNAPPLDGGGGSSL